MDPWGWALVAIVVAVMIASVVFEIMGEGVIIDLILGLMVGLLVSLFVFLAFLGVAVYTEHNSTVVEEHNIPLRSMSDTTEIEGRFFGSLFVQTGYINQDAVFRFYGKNDNGSYTLATVTAGHSEVVEGAYSEPYATCYRETVKDVPKIRGWFLGLHEHPWRNADDAQWCTFYVPNGSIVGDITLDTK